MFFKKRGLREPEPELLMPEELDEDIEEKVVVKPKKKKAKKEIDWSKNIWDLMGEKDKDEPPKNRW